MFYIFFATGFRSKAIEMQIGGVETIQLQIEMRE